MSSTEQRAVPGPPRPGPPKPASMGANQAEPPAEPRKKVQHIEFEQLYVDAMPCGEMYERSYMHRDVVTHLLVTPHTDFIITASRDGHVKFWKKQPVGVEFVKHFRSHLGPVTSLSVSTDGMLLCTTAEDKSVKVYDVINFDMINMMTVAFIPSCSCWLHIPGMSQPILACGAKDDRHIFLFRSDAKEFHQRIALHSAPVHFLAWNGPAGAAISVDAVGGIEYWNPADQSLPESVHFQYKSETDLYQLRKDKATAQSLAVDPKGTMFAVTGSDSLLRVWKFTTGKLYRVYDEGVSVYAAAQRDEASVYKLDSIDFGRRMAVEKDIASQGDAVPASNAVFDASGNFILVPTMMGIKVINVRTNRLVRLIGMVESTERFLSIALYQGTYSGSFELGDHVRNAKPDPTLFSCAYDKNRFYMFTRREPEEPDPDDPMTTGRDVFNERPSKEEEEAATSAPRLGSKAVIHTTMGDIRVELYPDLTPKTVENFIGLAKRGYYNGVIFHRIIRGFMIQTGDPLGDGTGGESIWGGDFCDEFCPKLRHRTPGMLSMANSGKPNTNGSQFFITTVPLSRLDDKHTIFGRVIKGMDTVYQLEQMPTDRDDRPHDPPKVVNITIK